MRQSLFFACFKDLKSRFLSVTRLSPNKNTIMHTALPVHTFMIVISALVIPSKLTSIERCKEKIETKASAEEMFLRVISFADALCRDLISLIVARVIFVKA